MHHVTWLKEEHHYISEEHVISRTWCYMEIESCEEQATTQYINKMNKNASDIGRRDAIHFSINKSRHSQ
jgi:hypothetical protein